MPGLSVRLEWPSRSVEVGGRHGGGTIGGMGLTSTRATKALDAAGTEYRVLAYDVSEAVGDGYGVAVAAAIGLPAAQVFKTLVAEVDGVAVVALVPVARRLSTKLLARVSGTKRCVVASPKVAERVTGYVVGGVSPFGQRRRLRTFVDESALEHGGIAVSGGRRGLQLVVEPQRLLTVLDAVTARLVT